MSRYQEGMTVLAVRDGDRHHLNVFGEGVYVGDRLLPGADEPMPIDQYMIIEAMLAEDDAIPLQEHWQLTMHRSYARRGMVGDATEDDVIALIEADRARPMDERVVELYRATRLNPCIYLDSGDIVWGCQCWWGSPQSLRERWPKAELVTVPVPEGNGRWKSRDTG